MTQKGASLRKDFEYLADEADFADLKLIIENIMFWFSTQSAQNSFLNYWKYFKVHKGASLRKELNTNFVIP